MAELTAADTTASSGGSCGCAAGNSTIDADALRETVRERYAAAALATTDPTKVAGCCGADSAIITDEQAELFGAGLYADGERDELPDTALLASLGCGNPTAMAELQEGMTVLDVGSNCGIEGEGAFRQPGPDVRRAVDETHRRGAQRRPGPRALSAVDVMHHLPTQPQFQPSARVGHAGCEGLEADGAIRPAEQAA